MASSTAAAPSTSEPAPASTLAAKSVDASLWWESFVVLAEELERAPLSDDQLPARLAEKVKRNHVWFLDSVTRFQPPNTASRLALDSPEVAIGPHVLVVNPEMKKASLLISEYLCLDEVQSYILVSRSFDINKSAGGEDREFLHLILLQYYLERQCLLKCIRHIFVSALQTNSILSSNKVFKTEASKLVEDGLEKKLSSIFEDLLASVYSDKYDVNLTVPWMEEVLIEDSLVLDIMFLAYYDNFCSCNSQQWKSLCSLFKRTLCGSLNIENTAVSVEAKNLFSHTKAKLLLLLIETLNLESILQLVHDEVPLRQGCTVFSSTDILEIDAQISSFFDLGVPEVGPLILVWAVFLCLVSSLPEANNNIMLMEINHMSYVRQAFQLSTFDYLLEIIGSDTFRDTDGPLSGFLSVVRTFISAFIASYEPSPQMEDSSFAKVLDILCQIYDGEESLSMQFWDKGSFIDGPIRSVLFTLEKEYPFHIYEFLRFLSALCEGTWPAECVYNYLDNMSGITMLFEIPGGTDALAVDDVIEAPYGLQVPDIEGLTIPSGTHGYIVKVVDVNLALVRWECAHSGILLILLQLSEDLSSDSIGEVFLMVKLLYRLVSVNKALCCAMMCTGWPSPIGISRKNRQTDTIMGVDLVQIVCSLILKLVRDVKNAAVASVCFNLLTEMLKCSPCHVMEIVTRFNIISVETDGASSGAWMLSGGLARMLMNDFSDNKEDTFELTNAVLNFTVHLLEKRADDSLVSPLIVFSLQYVFINHVQWRFKSNHSFWKMTIKILEVINSCVKAAKSSPELCSTVQGILYHDSSVHRTLCYIICISTEALKNYVNHNYKLKEIELLQLAVCSAFDVIHSLLDDLSQENFSNVQAFIQTMFSPSAKPMSVVRAAVPMISFSENSAVQIASARVISLFCFVVSKFQLYMGENISLELDVKTKELQEIIYSILNEEENNDEDVIIVVLDLLTSVAYFQPALLNSLLLPKDNVEILSEVTTGKTQQIIASSLVKASRSNLATPIAEILKYVEESEMDRSLNLSRSILKLLKAIWEGGSQYSNILAKVRSSEKFWKKMSLVIFAMHDKDCTSSNNHQQAALRHQCQGMFLEIMAHELFFHGKLLQNGLLEKERLNAGKSNHANALYPQEILSAWFKNDTMDNLLKSYFSNTDDVDVILRAKISVCVCVVHLIMKLLSGNAGSLSMSLYKKIYLIYDKLTGHPAFSLLLSQYALHGYSEKNELTNLVISDLYYHLQGELDGRQIIPGPFRELLYFLLGFEVFESKQLKDDRKLWLSHDKVPMFDVTYIHEELGTELWEWNHSNWKASKEVSEKMLFHIEAANIVASISKSKDFAMKALTSVISVFKGNLIGTNRYTLQNRQIPETFMESGIRSLCNNLQAMIDSLLPVPDLPDAVLRISTSLDLLLILSKILFSEQPERANDRPLLSLAVLIIKTSSSAIKVCADRRPLNPVMRKAMDLLLMLLLILYQFCYHIAVSKDKSDIEVKLLAEGSLTSVELLPVLCKLAEDTEYCPLCVTAMDVILKAFLTPSSWLPIIRKHLRLQLILQKVQEMDILSSGFIILNFLLTLGRTKGGAQMLCSVNFFTSLKGLLSQLPNGTYSSRNIAGYDLSNTVNDDKHKDLLGMAIAIISSVVYSLRDDSSCADIMVSAMRYFFSDKVQMTSCYLSALNYPPCDNSRKRTRLPTLQTSLAALRLTEQTLLFLCLLARSASWVKGIIDFDSELRDTLIHLLAVISKKCHFIGDSASQIPALVYQPTIKEEVELNAKPSFVKSKHGWFSLSTISYRVNGTTLTTGSTTLSPISKAEVTDNASSDNQSLLSDIMAINIYTIACLILNFLCMEAKTAAERAEDVEFIDLAHFPNFPTPDILHGLQDQAIAIVAELCRRKVEPKIENVCHLLLQILEKSLYLELCVYQSCGIRPVVGRIEDFSREIRVMTEVAEQHTAFKPMMKSLKQIISHVYPGLLQTGNFI